MKEVVGREYLVEGTPVETVWGTLDLRVEKYVGDNEVNGSVVLGILVGALVGMELQDDGCSFGAPHCSAI